MAFDIHENGQLLDDLAQVRDSGLANMLRADEVMDAASDLGLYDLCDYVFDNRRELPDMLRALAERGR